MIVRLTPTLLLLQLACASHTKLPTHIRNAIAAHYKTDVVALAQSHYYGPLYDENSMWLLSPYDFANTTHIVGLDGVPIHPQHQQGIVPAGSRFEIIDIEFPDPAALSRRMLTTPRYNPWVILKPIDDSGEGTTWRRSPKPFVLVLPPDLDSEKQVHAAIARILVPPKKMDFWLQKRSPQVRSAIRHKTLLPGMRADEMIASRGLPIHWLRDPGKGRTAWFGEVEAQLINGEIAKVRKGRKNCTPTGGCTSKPEPNNANNNGTAL